MTRNEAIEILEEIELMDDSIYAYNSAYMEALKMAISALEEIQQYREIGTVEECLEAVNMRTPERAIFEYMLGDFEGIFNCPVCGKFILHDCRDTESTFCERCGKHIQWGKNLEGTD